MMSEFRGFRCNNCGAIIEDPADRVKEKVILDGDGVDEAFYRDLCALCGPKRRAELPAQGYVPVPRRRRRRTTVSAVPAAG